VYRAGLTVFNSLAAKKGLICFLDDVRHPMD
jgi:hypothetical protein